MKKLSICIPTYNRKKYLNELLNSIFSQLTDTVKNKIEICISDNSENFETRDLIYEIKAAYPDVTIIYNKNEENIVDLNFIKVTQIANGEYCWIIGDDDIVKDSGIKEVLDALENNTDILIFQFDRYDKNMKKNMGTVEFMHGYRKSYDFSDIKDAYFYMDNAKKIQSIFCFLSNVVFRRNTWINENKIKRATGMYNTSGVQVYMHLDSMNAGCTLYYLNKSLVNYRLENIRVHYSDKSYVFRELWGLTHVIEESIENEVLKEKMIKLVKKDFPIYNFCGVKLSDEETKYIQGCYGSEDIMVFNQINVNLEKLYDECEGQTVVLFGASVHGEYLLKLLSDKSISVKYFCDNDKNKWGHIYNDIEVIYPERLKDIENIVVFIASVYVKEIYRQLVKIGVKNIKHIAYIIS